MEIGDPIDFVVCSSWTIAKVCDYASGAKDAQPAGTGKKPRSVFCFVFNNN